MNNNGLLEQQNLSRIRRMFVLDKVENLLSALVEPTVKKLGFKKIDDFLLVKGGERS